MSVRWFPVCLLAALGLAAACSTAPEVSTSAEPVSTTAADSTAEASTTTAASTTEAPTTTEPTTTTIDPIDELVASLTLEQKAGQLLMPILAGTDPDQVSALNERIGGGVPTIRGIVETFALGGVIYLGDNVSSAEQLTALSAGIDDAARSATPGVGALISVDQEGGRVNRITDGVEVFPSARSLAPDGDAVRSAAAATGTALAAQGINVVLAPVADLTDSNAGVIGNRSYGADPQTTAEMVVASIQGLQGAGVAATVKHWPGHGDTTLDSHVVLPSIDIDRLTWEQRERVPFAAAVEADVEIVMVGHLALPGLDASGAPATVSSVLIDQLLRAELGFDGVVMTDALDMGAVQDQDRGELVVQSIEAGVDILLAPPDVAIAHAAIVDAVRSGRISEDRLDASVARVLELKMELGLIAG